MLAGESSSSFFFNGAGLFTISAAALDCADSPPLSSNLLWSISVTPFFTISPFSTIHCSGHSAPTNSELCEIITTPPVHSLMATARPPRESLSR
ncbi:hypothetical protein OGAPHI_003344 [Ogataea philodendri]|uniref:Uncharacterized protein n=1 Tax=Ogataea philodendri TaxID=1378263 RepID=A0A9P8P8H8_9ASCO|nr:uncharacterized protein OGAPHI_003344 [Ogataea philodendri]KAH3666894.1 hypothetical protein OGAPHI_003344 [Ogataea philodendri]